MLAETESPFYNRKKRDFYVAAEGYPLKIQ